MTWFGVVLLAFWFVSFVIATTRVGKPREPLEASTMAILVVVYVALAAGVLVVGTGNGVGK